MTCAANPPPPEGFQIWRGIAPPPPLTQWAVDLRDHWMPRANYGATQTLDFDPGSGEPVLVLARKDHHTWTYKNGKLITGICIPGITLYRPTPAALNALGASAATSDTLETPDPSAAVYSVDPGTDWGLVGVTALAAAATVAAFLAGLHYAGTASRPRRLSR